MPRTYDAVYWTYRAIVAKCFTRPDALIVLPVDDRRSIRGAAARFLNVCRYEGAHCARRGHTFVFANGARVIFMARNGFDK